MAKDKNRTYKLQMELPRTITAVSLGELDSYPDMLMQLFGIDTACLGVGFSIAGGMHVGILYDASADPPTEAEIRKMRGMA